MANEVVTELTGRNQKLNQSLDQGKAMIQGFAETVPGLIAPIGAAIAGVFAVSTIKNFVEESIAAAQESEDAWAKWEATVRAAGGAIKVTRSALEDLGAEMIRNTKFTDEAVVESASLLSIYENLNGDVIPRTIRLAANMATLFDNSLTGSVRQLGRALDSPANGMRILRLAGVQLDETTRELIQSLQSQGRVAEAQEILFEKLESRFNGLAEAMGSTTSGRVEKLTNRFGEMKEQLGTALLPTLERILGSLEAFTTGFEQGLGADATESVRKLNEELTTTDKVLQSIGAFLPNVGVGFAEAGDRIALGMAATIRKFMFDDSEFAEEFDAMIATIQGNIDTRREASAIKPNAAVTPEELEKREQERISAQEAAQQQWIDALTKKWTEAFAIGKKFVDEGLKEAELERRRAEAADFRLTFGERQLNEEGGKGFKIGGGQSDGPFVSTLESLEGLYARISSSAASSPEKRIEQAVIDVGREQAEKLDQIKGPIQRLPDLMEENNNLMRERRVQLGLA